jgi:hypothetical protein
MLKVLVAHVASRQGGEWLYLFFITRSCVLKYARFAGDDFAEEDDEKSTLSPQWVGPNAFVLDLTRSLGIFLNSSCEVQAFLETIFFLMFKW